MDRAARTGMKWALTIIRNGEQGDTEKISNAEFRFGRKTGELDDSTAMRLPSSLISTLKEAGLVDEALESGFFVEMCSGDSNEGGWREFESAVTMPAQCSHSGDRSLYVDSEDSTLEFIQVGPPWARIELPEKISLKVSELPLRTTAWAVENGILEGPDGEQMTLHQWTELPEQEVPDDLEELPMPGPSTSSYEFL